MGGIRARADLREYLGRRVREVWIQWAKEQPNPKPSWLTPWDVLPEIDREVDRRIGETIWNDCLERHDDCKEDRDVWRESALRLAHVIATRNGGEFTVSDLELAATPTSELCVEWHKDVENRCTRIRVVPKVAVDTAADSP